MTDYGNVFRRLRRNTRGFLWKKIHGYKHVPTFASIEITNRCNTDCTYCPRKYMPEACDMDYDLFTDIIDAIPFVSEVVVQGIGEPVLHPYFVDLLDYAKMKKKRVLFYTNASLFNEDFIYSVLSTHVDEIRFSVDGHNKSLFNKTRSLDWDRVLKNIKLFRLVRDQHTAYKTQLSVRITVTKHNRAVIEDVIAFWEGIVDHVGVQPEEDLLLPTKNLWTEGFQGGYCYRVYDELHIKCNGDIQLCCKDWFDQYPIANVAPPQSIYRINSKQILNAYNGLMYRHARERINSGDLPALCHGCPTLRRHK